MTENKYYELIDAYILEINNKQFNESFYNSEKLDEIISKLSAQLQYMITTLECAIGSNIASNCEFEDYTLKCNRLCCLQEKIASYSTIESEDYEYSYTKFSKTIHGIPIYVVVIIALVAIFYIIELF